MVVLCMKHALERVSGVCLKGKFGI